MAVQSRDDHGRQLDAPPAGGRLGFYKHVAHPRLVLKRPAYLQPAARQVHIRPAQAQQFPLAHTGRDGQYIQRFETVSGCRCQQLVYLLTRERVHLLTLQTWMVG